MAVLRLHRPQGGDAGVAHIGPAATAASTAAIMHQHRSACANVLSKLGTVDTASTAGPLPVWTVGGDSTSTCSFYGLIRAGERGLLTVVVVQIRFEIDAIAQLARQCQTTDTGHKAL